MKYHYNKEISGVKVWRLAQRFSEMADINYKEMFAPIVRKKSLCIFLAISIIPKIIIFSVNIIGANLKSFLNDNKFTIFMKLPLKIYKLYEIYEELKCRLLKSLYGLKQLRQLWNQNNIAFFTSFDIIQINRYPNIFIHYVLNKKTTIMSIYIDNFFLASNCSSILDILMEVVSQKCSIKDLAEV